MSKIQKAEPARGVSFRGSLFASGVIHGAAVLAILALFAFKNLAPPQTEVSLGDGTKVANSAPKKGIEENATAAETENDDSESVNDAGGSVSAGVPNSQKSGDSDANLYFSELQRRIQAQERYPSDAKKRGIESTIEISFQLDEQGQIIEIHANSEGKPAVLVDAAVAAVKAASPFSPPPPGSLRVFQIPIEFKIK